MGDSAEGPRYPDGSHIEIDHSEMLGKEPGVFFAPAGERVIYVLVGFRGATLLGVPVNERGVQGAGEAVPFRESKRKIALYLFAGDYTRRRFRNAWHQLSGLYKLGVPQ